MGSPHSGIRHLVVGYVIARHRHFDDFLTPPNTLPLINAISPLSINVINNNDISFFAISKLNFN